MEDEFKSLVRNFIEDKLSADEFMTSFIALWCENRDSGALYNSDARLGRLLDRMFTSCDAYEAVPDGPSEIDSVQFKLEIQDMAYLCWGI
jgi:hypothetical protein